VNVFQSLAKARQWGIYIQQVYYMNGMERAERGCHNTTVTW
jgi:hypothetical protein